MGSVYLGRDVSLDRKVAVKVLPVELADDTGLHQRFIREARAQARLQSARVAHIYHIGRTPPDRDGARSLYFAMELVSGGSLDDRIESGGALDPEACRQWLLQAAEGLRDAQAAGIVHRDIKPGNLLFDHTGDIKIADFGVALPLDAESDGEERLSLHGTVVGSPLYMAPEQAKGLDVDFRADMYALGATFYHALTGTVPYDGNTALAVVTQHLTAPIPDVRDRREAVPRKLAAIVHRLMAKEPEERYPSYDALARALEDAAPTRDYAGFWVRVTAAAADGFIGGLAIGLLGWPAIFLHLTYLSVAHARYGRTVGKYLMNLRVERTDGSPLSLRGSIARTLVSMWMPIWVAFTVLFTEGFDTLAVLIERLDARELDAVRSLATAVVIGNALMSLLYVAGLALAAFHPHKRAMHDLVVSSQVRFDLKKAPESTPDA